MIGVVVVTHGRLADEMLRTLAGVLGPVSQLEGVSMGAEDDPERLRGRIRRAIERADAGEGVLILTDMLGDTATNLSLALCGEIGAEVVAGLNMPMLVKAVTSRSGMGLRELAALITEYGRKHIFWASRKNPAITGARR